MLNLPLTFGALFQAVDYLNASGVSTIERSLCPHTRHGSFVWDCFSPEDLDLNARLILEGAALDYEHFVVGNQFGRLNSELVSNSVSLLYFGSPSACQGSNRGPRVHGFWLRNIDRTLPKFTFIDSAVEPQAVNIGKNPEQLLVNVKGKVYECVRMWSPLSGCFRERLPIRYLLYEMLKCELEHRYGNDIGL